MSDDKSISSKDDIPARPVGVGVEVIRRIHAGLPRKPGVYRMLSQSGDVLYVGKAKNLKARVAAYTRIDRMPFRLQRMVSETADMEIVTTHTEAEALLLESNLIKSLKPRYNILLRDDKSFPYVRITGETKWPRIVKYRGDRAASGEYFGPFASARSVNHTLIILQKAFLLRSCSDSVFNNRTRPCLLHQIKRCSAPCVDRISKQDYDDLLAEARGFLKGDTRIQAGLAKRMEEASQALDFEKAAEYRDRIRALTAVQARQDIVLPGVGEADVMSLYREGGQACIQVFFFRGGQNYGNRAYFPSHAADDADADILEAFVGQFYARSLPPKMVLLSETLAQHDLLVEALALRAGYKVHLSSPQRGEKRKVIEHARLNAREALMRRLAENASQARLLDGVADLFDLPGRPERIEVYDNSHISGTDQVGAMIVAGPEGFMKNAYRKFNIKRPETAAGDDYAMMREVMSRRFTRALKEDPERTNGQWPDVVLIDGGKGQLSSVQEALDEIGVEDVMLVSIAKGPDRNAGRERFFLPDRKPFSLPHEDPVLYYLQRLRDEAHRFAISAHRTRRGSNVRRSILDGIPGIGAKRKKALLHYFGSAQAVATAGQADLANVEGISAAVAKKIYDHFNSDG